MITSTDKIDLHQAQNILHQRDDALESLAKAQADRAADAEAHAKEMADLKEAQKQKIKDTIKSTRAEQTRVLVEAHKNNQELADKLAAEKKRESEAQALQASSWESVLLPKKIRYEKEQARKIGYLLKRQKIHLIDEHCPGDFMVLTAAVEAVATWYPLLYTFKVTCIDRGRPCPEIFANNPHCSEFERPDQTINMHYDALAESEWRDVRFLDSYCQHLGDNLGIPLKTATLHPVLYFSPEEVCNLKTPRPGPYAVINSGYKLDGPLKNWGFANWVEVVAHVRERGLEVVQIGSLDNNNAQELIPGVIDWRGRTANIRDLFLLVHHPQCHFGMGHESFLHHVFASAEKPFVCVASGLYQKTWTNYVTEQFITRQGTMDCCRFGGCGLTLQPVSKCTHPDRVGNEAVGGCMARIKPAEVIAAIEQWYAPGGILADRMSRNGSFPNA